MRTKLGVAGLPADLNRIATLGEELGISLVLLQDGPCTVDLPDGFSALSLDFSHDELHVMAALKAASLAGVWVADARYRERIESRIGRAHV